MVYKHLEDNEAVRQEPKINSCGNSLVPSPWQEICSGPWGKGRMGFVLALTLSPTAELQIWEI